MHITYKTIPVKLLDAQGERVFECSINQILEGDEDLDKLEEMTNWCLYDERIFFTLDKGIQIEEGLHLNDDYYIVKAWEDEATRITFKYDSHAEEL